MRAYSMNNGRKLTTKLKCFLEKNQMLVSVGTFSGLLSLGDCISQKLTSLHWEKHVGVTSSYDFDRTARMCVLGTLLGPFSTGFYRILDRFIKNGPKLQQALTKIAADQFIGSPIFYTFFLTGGAALEGKNRDECMDEWNEKFWKVYMTDWCVWPAAQFINFYFLPPIYRVIYVSFLSLFWNTYLSIVLHTKIPPHEVLVAQAKQAMMETRERRLTGPDLYVDRELDHLFDKHKQEKKAKEQEEQLKKLKKEIHPQPGTKWG